MIVIQCALRAEAQGFIENLNLKRDLNFKGFELFYNADFLLIISGIGKLACATATGALLNYALNKCRQTDILALNFGTAGSPELNIGTVVLPLKISTNHNQNYYPEIICAHNFQTNTLYTMDSAVSVGAANIIYDMEGSAFFAAAAHFLDTHQFLSIKIISDNLAPQDFSLEASKDLCRAKVPEVLEYLQSLHQLICSLKPATHDNELNIITTELKLSTSQARIMESKFSQLRALGGTIPSFAIDRSSSADRKKIYSQIITKLDNQIKNATE